MGKSIFQMIFGSKEEKDVKALKPVVEKVNAQESWAKNLRDEEFPQITDSFREKVRNGTKLDDLLPQAFALAREASFRVLGQRHYDVQIMGAAVLQQGKILEMKTGEGKTLTCVPAAYLNALEGAGVHVITVNDYLAQRDAEWMGPVYRFLGLTVGVIVSSMDNEARRQAYSCDITYGTNNEFGFDYLRDNMKWDMKDKIQPKHHYCIIDEIDSILIDEARTPLIISGQSEDDSPKVIASCAIAPFLVECEKDPATDDYYQQDPLARFDKNAEPFDEKGDFKIDEKQKNITFTNQGLNHIESLLQKNGTIQGSLYDGSNFEYVHYVTQAVKALKLFHVDVDYVIQDGQVQIVDEFTGRILYGRRYSDGLHQAIEAKEHIRVMGQNRTLATITFQNFFRMYDKISGMTGTAATDAAEFNKIYGLDVVVIPTNRPVIRKDLQDLIYLNEQFKYQAICAEIVEAHKKGQPILVGTVSIEKSEFISTLLKKIGIKHEVLNAKNHAREATIIENAGAKGSVTIATNMAGRGTDIKLGGSLEARARKLVGTDASPEELNAAMEKLRPEWEKDYEEVKNLGGLYIIGTERHESRRIDNQLRGRSGRQGDPGKTRFYVSLEDSLMRLFANDSIKAMLGKLGMQTGEPIEHKMVSNAIEKAQQRVEERNFDIRKHLLDYDDVLNEQRNFIYSQRDEILTDPHLYLRVLDSISGIVENMVHEEFSKKNSDAVAAVYQKMKDEFFFDIKLEDANIKQEDLIKHINEKIEAEVKEKVALVGEPVFNDFTRFHYLRQIDLRWQDHLSNLEELRDAVGLRTYAQKNPLVEYKLEGYEIFEKMIDDIVNYMAKLIVRAQVRENTQQRRSYKTVEQHLQQANFAQERRAQANAGQTSSVTVRRTTPKIGRNDPCPCGSGKKYKNCCGRNA